MTRIQQTAAAVVVLALVSINAPSFVDSTEAFETPVSSRRVASEVEIDENGPSELLHNASEGGKTADDGQDDNKVESSCGIYMAPSSMHGNKGLGLYAARDFQRNEPLLKAPDGPSIVVVDFYQFDHDPDDRVRELRKKWIDLFDQYWWGRGVSDQVKFEGKTTIDFQIMFGSLPNHHCVLEALTLVWPNPHYDEHGVNRLTSPGAGGFSYHRGRQFMASRRLTAGEEIFLNYGHCGPDEEIPEGSWKETVVRTHHYHEVTNALRQARFAVPREHRGLRVSEMPEEYIELMLSTLKELTEDKSDQTRSITPQNKEELLKVLGKQPNNQYMNFEMRLARYLNAVPRSEEWVRENGMCLDNLVPKRSTLPHAGQGAFTQHSLSKGELIIPVPLLQIHDPRVLNMYNEDGKQYSTQILMNYCLGHHESSLLLCPNTNAILINHCSSRKGNCGGHDGPNAVYRWAGDWDPDTEVWLGRSLEEIEQQNGRVLAMEIRALREIEAGEEIFVDYGEKWEEAWDAHAANWKPPSEITGYHTYASTKELNKNSLPPDNLVVGDLRERFVDDGNAFTACLYWTTRLDEDEYWAGIEYDPTWTELSDEEILRIFADDGSFYREDFNTTREEHYWPCTVIRADQQGVDGEDPTFVVRMEGSYWGHYTAWSEKEVPRFLTHYPAQSIRYFNKPYSSDQFLPDAFRHPIGIRDEIFPLQWKNLANSGE